MLSRAAHCTVVGARLWTKLKLCRRGSVQWGGLPERWTGRCFLLGGK